MRVPLKKQLARYIRRQLLGTSLRAVARKTNISPNTLSRLRKGEAEVLTSTIDEVRKGFKCTLQDIFPDEFSKTNSDGTGANVNPAQKPVWTQYREPEYAPIRPVMAFLGFIFAQIGLFCRQIKVIP